ncbi:MULTISPECIES: toprim domain-containing protein [unclassified Arenibacter]|uniref:toprim domain-containing protein n=1 Tax=unclassified Arenibacter TaxID=2615047 RepID=UPI000E34F7A8|nr:MULTISPECIES: toprim domain-containing protein [unclassified Arenibacter]MCM4162603.1 DNA primase [Arenibacter sp. A80]RFT58376.1 DNA primase [Arenibacter sp. P308M17]
MHKKRTFRTRCETARAFPIEKALAKLGHFPARSTEKEAWFLSPFRPEYQASFKVSKELNRWYDHGAGRGGNVIDLVCIINGSSVKETLDWLENGQISFSFQQRPLIPEQNASGIRVRYARPIGHFALIGYLNSRKIPVSTAAKLCQEVHYILRGRNFFAIGLKNDSGGWELRNKYYKNSSSPKDITYIKNGNRRLIVTEGMFDMLSLLERDKNLMEKNDLLILNSLAFVEKIPGVIKRYQSIALYLDNDKAGKSATKLLMEQSPKCRDMSNLYKDFKDVNAWLMSKKL